MCIGLRRAGPPTPPIHDEPQATVHCRLSGLWAKSRTGPSQVAEIYTREEGNLTKLAEMFGLAADMLNDKAPESAEEFATKLLDGAYTGPKHEHNHRRDNGRNIAPHTTPTTIPMGFPA